MSGHFVAVAPVNTGTPLEPVPMSNLSTAITAAVKTIEVAEAQLAKRAPQEAAQPRSLWRLVVVLALAATAGVAAYLGVPVTEWLTALSGV
jgi:anti-sigma-K factor RskA